jgi:hypothetical protein
MDSLHAAIQEETKRISLHTVGEDVRLESRISYEESLYTPRRDQWVFEIRVRYYKSYMMLAEGCHTPTSPHCDSHSA